MARFVRPYRIRFEDCDSAGIVFYPCYILMLHRLFEDWCAEALGVSLGKMHQDRKIGFPIVNLQVDFKKASRLEEVLELSLEVRKLGVKSLTIVLRASCAGEERLAGEITVVSANLVAEGVASREIPPDIRERMEAFCTEPVI